MSVGQWEFRSSGWTNETSAASASCSCVTQTLKAASGPPRHKNGSIVETEMLRPIEWIEERGLRTGSQIVLLHTEIDTGGVGRVLSIEDCPPIAAGDGAVVVSRVKTHLACDLHKVLFANGEAMTGTGNHLVWSIDREGWVPLADLLPAEQVESFAGGLRVTSVTPLPDYQAVFNLEVHGEHVYHLTSSGILVHNDGICDEVLKLRALEAQKRLSRQQTRRLKELNSYIADYPYEKILRTVSNPPKWMKNPHAHHILFKKGLGPAQQELANEGAAILRRAGIDPIFGTENLYWAPNIAGQHTIEALTHVVETLREVEKRGGDYDDFVEALRTLGEEAARRK